MGLVKTRRLAAMWKQQKGNVKAQPKNRAERKPPAALKPPRKIVSGAPEQERTENCK